MIGQDVEFFLTKDGLCMPALRGFEASGLLGWVEEYKPIPGPNFPGYISRKLVLPKGTVVEDGAAIETPCNPARSAGALLKNMRQGVLAAQKIADAVGFDLVVAPLIFLSKEDIATRPELQVLGCDPDRNLWMMRQKCVPEQDPQKVLWRTGGGHIHISPPNRSRQRVQNATVILCDLLLGTLDVMLESTALARQRRTMYGQAGKHRIQPHGIEYRTMTNTWAINPEVALGVFKIARLIEILVSLEAEYKPGPVFRPSKLVDSINSARMIRAINECDRTTCNKIWLFTIESIHERCEEPLTNQEFTARELIAEIPFDLFKEIYLAGGIGQAAPRGPDYTVHGWDKLPSCEGNL